MMGVAIMGASRRRHRAAIPLEAFDVGPRLRVARGELRVEDAADPDNPNRTIRRARVEWVPDRLLADGTIEQHHHHAATRYAVSYERGPMGAREQTSLGIRLPRAAPAGLPVGRHMATRDYQLATQAVGILLAPALAWCVIGRGTLAGWAECRGWADTGRATGYLLAALDRLTEHYDGA